MRIRRSRSDEGSHSAYKRLRLMLILRWRTATRSWLRMTGKRNGAYNSGVVSLDNDSSTGTVDLREGSPTGTVGLRGRRLERREPD